MKLRYNPFSTMECYMFSRRIFISWVIVFSSMIMVTATATAQEGAAKKSVFSKSTFDLGIVVSDLDKAAKFYVEVVG